MELGLRWFFRLGVCLLLLFVAFRNFRGFPQETKAIALRFGYRNRGGGYNSNYGGRMIYTNFGRSRSSGGNRDPVDKDRLYYETKMAQWREKNKHLLVKNETGEEVNDLTQDFDNEEEEDNNSDSQEYDYDYQETTESTTTMEPNMTTIDEDPISEDSQVEQETTTTEKIPESTTTPGDTKLNRASRKSFGMRYGQVKVVTLKH